MVLASRWWGWLVRDNEGFACHVHHAMVSYEIHHVWPQCYHGPDIVGNRVKICPNAHSDIHYAMERLLRGKEVRLVEYGRRVRELALEGYLQVTAYAESLVP